MNNLITTFSEFSTSEGFDMHSLMALLKEIFAKLIKRKFGINENFTIINNANRGEFRIIWERLIVPDEEFTDFRKEIMLSKAKLIQDDCTTGEQLYEEFSISDLGPDAITEAHEFFMQRLMEIKSHRLIDRYEHLYGNLMTGQVVSFYANETILVNEMGDEMILHKSEQIPGEFFRPGEVVKVILVRIGIRGDKAVLFVSRVHCNFLIQLLAFEINEIYHGLIKVFSYSRIPGIRSKVILISNDNRIDAIAACVGLKGYKISRVIRELRKESLDFIEYSDNIELLVSRLLTPAVISYVNIDEEKRTVNVYLLPEQVQLALGPDGTNLKLVSVLMDYKIDLYCTDDSDI